MVRIFDTTLRDGEQTPGVNLNTTDKVRIALQLERLGVDVIEAGFANASHGDFEAVSEVAKAVKKSTICSLARAHEADVRAAAKALRFADNARIHVVIATSDIHMQYKLKMTPEQVYKRAMDSIKLAKSLCDEIEFSPEDATRTRPEFLFRVLSGAIEAGAKIINIPDTVGYATVREFGRLLEDIRANVDGIDSVTLGVHCHDDLGLAVANSLEAVRCGARQIECTVNGMGERAGNAALEEIVMGLATRGDEYGCSTGIVTKELYRTSRMVASVSNVELPPNKAIVGANAFLHESGIHQHGVLNNRATYEVMKAEDIGIIGAGMVLGKLSGKHAFEERAIELGYKLSPADLDRAFSKFKDMADRKRFVSSKDIDAILGEQITEVPAVFMLDSFQVFSNNKLRATATISLTRDGDTYTEAAVGNGPVDASFIAIDRISGYELELDRFRIRAATEGRDALGEVIVKVRYKGQAATGKAISSDVIEASVMAYINALNRIISENVMDD